MKNWLKINLDQNNHSPIGIKNIISNKYNNLHNLLIEQAKEQALITYQNNDEYVFLKDITGEEIFDKNDNIIFVDSNKNKCEYSDAVQYINLNDWKIVETNKIDDNYLSAPYIICTSRHNISNNGIVSIEKYMIDLSPWWSIEYLSEEIKKNNGITTEILDKYKFNEIKYYDYINEIAILDNRVETEERKIGFKEISENDVPNITYKSIIK